MVVGVLCATQVCPTHSLLATYIQHSLQCGHLLTCTIMSVALPWVCTHHSVSIKSSVCGWHFVGWNQGKRSAHCVLTLCLTPISCTRSHWTPGYSVWHILFCFLTKTQQLLVLILQLTLWYLRRKQHSEKEKSWMKEDYSTKNGQISTFFFFNKDTMLDL